MLCEVSGCVNQHADLDVYMLIRHDGHVYLVIPHTFAFRV